MSSHGLLWASDWRAWPMAGHGEDNDQERGHEVDWKWSVEAVGPSAQCGCRCWCWCWRWWMSLVTAVGEGVVGDGVLLVFGMVVGGRRCGGLVVEEGGWT